MAFANARDFSINQALMLDQSNSNNINQINVIATEVQSGRLSPIIEVPPSTTQMFTGQEIYLEALNKHFKNDANDKTRKYFLLYGIGGIGKTQICLKYKDDSEDDYEYMFWIDSTSNETITQSLKDIYKSHLAVQNLAFSASAVLNWISSFKTKWLMIYDNADGVPGIVENCLPPGNKGDILITSRNQALRKITTNKNSMEVNKMTNETALRLLLNSSGLETQYEQYKDIANDIVSELHGIPLAIAQAGAYIMHGECDITQYLDIYRKHRAKLLSNEQYGGASKYSKSVYGTWELSYQQLIKMSENLDKAAAAKYAMTIINISAFYHYLNIPMAIFERAAEHYNSLMNKYVDDIRPIFLNSMAPELFVIDENGQWNEMTFNQAIALLISFSLIRKDSRKYYSFHPLIQQWCQDRLENSDRMHWILVSGGMLATSIKNENTLSEAIYLQQITLHLSNSVSKLNRLDYYHDIFSMLGIASMNTGNYKNACCLLQEEVKKNEESHGKGHNYTLNMMDRLAWAYECSGKLAEAESLQIQVLDARKRILGDEHPVTLTSMNNLALTYSELGKLSEAEGLQIHELDAQKRILGDEHPNTLTSMSNLAWTYSELGKLSEAEGLQIQVLDARKRILGDEHPVTLTSMNNLASTYYELGKLSEAEGLQIQVLDAQKRILGDEHPNTLTSISNLGWTYSELRKLSEAEGLQIQVLDAQKRILGDDHPNTLTSMNNLALTYLNLGKLPEAEGLQIQVLDARKRILGDEHPVTLTGMHNLALTYSELGKLSEAEGLQIQVLEARKRILGDEHPHTLTSMAVLASIYSKLGKLSDAEGLQIQGLEARKRILGEEHPATLSSMDNLALTYSKLGKLSEAEGLQIHVLDARKRILGDEHPHTLTSMNNLAFTYGKVEKWNKAETLRLQELEKRRQIWGDEHTDTLACMAYLFEIDLNLGKSSEAKQLRLQIIDIMERMKANGIELNKYVQWQYDYVYNTQVSTEGINQQTDLDHGEGSSSGTVKKESKMRSIFGKFRKSLKLNK